MFIQSVHSAGKQLDNTYPHVNGYNINNLKLIVSGKYEIHFGQIFLTKNDPVPSPQSFHYFALLRLKKSTNSLGLLSVGTLCVMNRLKLHY